MLGARQDTPGASLVPRPRGLGTRLTKCLKYELVYSEDTDIAQSSGLAAPFRMIPCDH